MASTIRRIGTKLAITGGVIVAVTGITAANALAATTLYRVQVGSSSTGSTPYTASTATNVAQAIKFVDVTQNVPLGCKSGTAAGTLYKGSSRTAAKVATISSTGWTSCTGPLNLALFPTQVGTWNINLNGKTSTAGVTQGNVSGVKATVAAANASSCSFTVSGSVPGQFANASQKLTIFADAASPYKLAVSDVVGCFGQVQNGDQVTFAATYTVKASADIKIRSTT